MKVDGKNDLGLVDEQTLVKVKTNNKDFNEVIEGYFGYVDDETIHVGDEIIPIKYIDEIEIINS